MALILNSQNHTAEGILQVLSGAFPDLKPYISNKTTIIIPKKKISCVVRLRKNKIKIYGDLNTKHPLNMILIIFGILLGLFGVLLFAPILYLSYAKANSKFKREVFSALNNSVNV